MLVEGKAEIYAAKGELSFRASAIERIGLGDHLAAIERLKRLLAAEGLFAPDRKQPLPRFPRAVGIVTGADAAARGDLVTGIRTRFPPARIVVAETRVQGAGAAGGNRRRPPRSPATPTSTSSSSPAEEGASRTCSRSATRPSCAPSRRALFPSSRPSATSRIRRSVISQPTPAPPHRRQPPASSSPTSCELERGLERLRDAPRPAPSARDDRSRSRAARTGPRPAPRRTTPDPRAAASRPRQRGRPAPGTLATGYTRSRLRHRALERIALRNAAATTPGQRSRSSSRSGGLSATVGGGTARERRRARPSRSSVTSSRRSSESSSAATSRSTKRSGSGSEAKSSTVGALRCSRPPRDASRSSPRATDDNPEPGL